MPQRTTHSLERLYRTVVHVPIGDVVVVCSDKGLRELQLSPSNASGLERRHRANNRIATVADRSNPGAKVARQAATELQEYFAGRRQRFDVPLDLQGTAFQKKVWKALLQIPYGKTRSYGEIARAVGNPTAARAIGGANHSNPAAIVVPCHRVIASDGSLGGYGAGLHIKSRLLHLEQNRRSESR